jgi:hypothetical protein
MTEHSSLKFHFHNYAIFYTQQKERLIGISSLIFGTMIIYLKEPP